MVYLRRFAQVEEAYGICQRSSQALLQAAEASACNCGGVEGHPCCQVKQLHCEGVQMGNRQRSLPSQVGKVLH